MSESALAPRRPGGHGGGRGRPRDPDMDQAILRATVGLLTEMRYVPLTLAGVARRAGVSRCRLGGQPRIGRPVGGDARADHVHPQRGVGVWPTWITIAGFVLASFLLLVGVSRLGTAAERRRDLTT